LVLTSGYATCPWRIGPHAAIVVAAHDIRTTRRYAHFSPSFAAKQILKVQRDESVSLRQLMFGFEVGVGPKQDQSVDELERLYALQPVK